MSYRNLKDKPRHKPRLLVVYGTWHCYSHSASGTGATPEKAHRDWWWNMFKYLRSYRSEWLHKHVARGIEYGYYLTDKKKTPVRSQTVADYILPTRFHRY